MTSLDLKQAWNAVVKPPNGWQGDLYFYNKLGQKIRYGYAPPDGEQKGTVVLTHGYAENIDLYYETIKRYQNMGYAVWAMDWQGHGKSDRDDPMNPRKPSARGMLRHTHDLDFFVNNVVKDYHNENTPLILNSHSMGGHIGLLYMKKFPGVFDGAVLSAPMLDIYRLGMGSWGRPIIKFIFNMASKIGLHDKHVPEMPKVFSKISALGKKLMNMFNKDTSFRGELRELMKELNPETIVGRPTFGWLASAYKTIIPSMKEDFLKSIHTPVLIGSAEIEDLVANDSHERAARLMPNATRVTIKNARHGLWFEDDDAYEQWWEDVERFVKKLEPINSYERSNDKTTKDIAAGKDISRTLRGNIICHNRSFGNKSHIDHPCSPPPPV